MRQLIITLFIFIAFLTSASDRLALVIGNNDYRHIGKLQNPINDANAVADKLQRMGFYVIQLNNGDRAALLRTVHAFSQKINRNTKIALFYYSGHGLQYENQSYLVPVDAKIETGADVPIFTLKGPVGKYRLFEPSS